MSATQQSDRVASPRVTGAATAQAAGPGAAVDATGATPPRRFRAATVEDALRQASELLGEDAEIIEANRIRRGGIGGFFATELGVEVLAQSAADTVSRRSSVEPSAPGADSEHALLGRSARSARPGGSVPDTGPATGPATDYGAVPGRGRAAWRAASAEAGAAMPAHEADAAPSGAPSLFHEILERAATDQLAAAHEGRAVADVTAGGPPKIFRAWRVHDGDAADARPSMFDDDVEAAATDVTTERAPDARGSTPEATTAAADADTPVESPTSFAEHFLRELMTDAEVLRNDQARSGASGRRRRPRSDAPTLPGITVPIGEPAAAPISEPEAAPVHTAQPRRAPRRRPSRPAVRTEVPELPLEPLPDASATMAATASTTAGSAAQTGALGAIVDQCLQLAAAADGDGPRKVALAVTMGDGQVVKITIEPSRGR
jgi:hypothetical protein